MCMVNSLLGKSTVARSRKDAGHFCSSIVNMNPANEPQGKGRGSSVTRILTGYESEHQTIFTESAN